MFPASNSTLYYEQAIKQVSELVKHKVFTIPMKVVGLFEEKNAPVNSHINTYKNARYSRELVSHEIKEITLASGRSSSSRCSVQVLPMGHDRPIILEERHIMKPNKNGVSK
jgi:hypothetical protein